MVTFLQEKYHEFKQFYMKDNFQEISTMFFATLFPPAKF